MLKPVTVRAERFKILYAVVVVIAVLVMHVDLVLHDSFKSASLTRHLHMLPVTLPNPALLVRPTGFTVSLEIASALILRACARLWVELANLTEPISVLDRTAFRRQLQRLSEIENALPQDLILFKIGKYDVALTTWS